jgi:hypothetical protein
MVYCLTYDGDTWCHLKLRTQSTGKMDEATSKAMWQPRCGEKDLLSYNKLHGRTKRYTHWGECYRQYWWVSCLVILDTQCNYASQEDKINSLTETEIRLLWNSTIVITKIFHWHRFQPTDFVCIMKFQCCVAQESASDPSPKSCRSGPYPPILFFKIHFNMAVSL